MHWRKEGFKAVQNLYVKTPGEKVSKLDTKLFRGNMGKKKGRGKNISDHKVLIQVKFRGS